jgi:tetratricopeptide (TPR) repeat protein
LTKSRTGQIFGQVNSSVFLYEPSVPTSLQKPISKKGKPMRIIYVILLTSILLLVPNAAAGPDCEIWVPLFPDAFDEMEFSDTDLPEVRDAKDNSCMARQAYQSEDSARRATLTMMEGEQSFGMKGYLLFGVVADKVDNITWETISGYKILLDLDKENKKSRLFFSPKKGFVMMLEVEPFADRKEMLRLGKFLPFAKFAETTTSAKDSVKNSQAAPLDAEGYYNLGIDHDEAGRYQEAIEAYKQAIKLKPDYASAYNDLGCAYNDLGRHQEASEAFKQAIKLKPDYATANYNLGIACYALGRYQEAIDAYKQAIKLKPDDIDAHYNLGIAYLGIKDKASALKEFEILKKMDLVRASQLSNKIASAEKDLSQAAPLDADGYFNLGVDHADAGQWKEAIEAFKQAIKLNPDDASAHYNLGVAYGNLGRHKEEIEAYKQAIKLNPDYAKAYNNLGSAYQNSGRHQEAIQACKQAVKLKPDYANAHYTLGMAYMAIGDKKRALNEYNLLKPLNPEWANTLLNLINK